MRASRGFNLPELMVSLTLGLILLAAFLVILDRCRRDFATNESLAQPAGCGASRACPCWCRTWNTPVSMASPTLRGRSSRATAPSSPTPPACASPTGPCRRHRSTGCPGRA